MSERDLRQDDLEEGRVVEYLRRHPDFFLRHRALLEQVRIPHEVRGAVSLVEFNLTRQRERIQGLEQEMQSLLANASRNERIFRVYADIYPELFACTSLCQLWRRLHTSVRDKLHIPASALWLNGGRVAVKRSDKRFLLAEAAFLRLCRQSMAGEAVYFGPIATEDKQTLFGAEALVHSVALMRLGEQGEQGLIAFGHANPEHYHAGMDSLLLEQLGRFVTLLLPNLVVAGHD